MGYTNTQRGIDEHTQAPRHWVHMHTEKERDSLAGDWSYIDEKEKRQRELKRLYIHSIVRVSVCVFAHIYISLTTVTMRQ